MIYIKCVGSDGNYLLGKWPSIIAYKPSVGEIIQSLDDVSIRMRVKKIIHITTYYKPADRAVEGILEIVLEFDS